MRVTEEFLRAGRGEKWIMGNGGPAIHVLWIQHHICDWADHIWADHIWAIHVYESRITAGMTACSW